MKRLALIALICVGTLVPAQAKKPTPKPSPSVTTAPTAAPSAPVKTIVWTENPPSQQIKEYQVWKAKKGGNVMVATVTANQYTPASHGTYFIKAVNARGVSDKSATIKD